MDRREFLDTMAEQIRAKKARPAVIEEMEAHIEDQKLAFMLEGMSEAEAEQEAVNEMGDPVAAGVALDRVHRPKMEWSVLAAVLLLSLLGLTLQALVPGVWESGTVNGPSVWPSLSAGEGFLRYAMYMVAGIVLMMAVCWMDYSLIGKHAAAFWIAVHAALLLISIFAPPVNGRPQGMQQLACLIVPAYAGLVYHFRGQGKKGFFKCVGCLMLSLVFLRFYYMLTSMLLIGAVGLILLTAAVHKGWYGVKKRGLYLLLWLPAVILPAGMIGLIMWGGPASGRFPAAYQAERLAAWLHPGSYELYNGPLSAVVQAARGGVPAGEMDGVSAYIRNDYIWRYIYECTGVWKGILLTALVAAMWIFLLVVVHRQKNRLGYIVSLGCVLFLGMQTFCYIGMNMEMLPAGGVFMPFVSYGGSYLLVSYFYMGLLLSVCRNSRVLSA